MDVFRLDYRVGNQWRVLRLDVRARRWTARVVIRTVIRHEFPDAEMPDMKAGAWIADQVLAQVGISGLTCTYVDEIGPSWTGQITASGIVIGTSCES